MSVGLLQFFGNARPSGKANINLSNPSSNAYLNLFHSLNPATSLTPSVIIPTLNSDGYPAGTLASDCGAVGGTVDSTYYGHYYIWWTGNGSLQVNQPILVYAGGQATNLGTSTGAIIFNSNFGGTSTLQPTQSVPVEWAFGSLISSVGTNGGLVEFTVTLNSFSSSSFATNPSLTVANASISGDGTTATVTTAVPHGLPTGLVLKLSVAGATPSGFNGSNFCTVTGASTFTYLNATSGTASVVGTWTPFVANYQFNNLTGIPVSSGGPNIDGSWTCYTSANNKIVVSSSSSYAGSVSITSTGGPGSQSEAILSVNSISTLSTTLKATSGAFTSYTWSNAFWVKKADQAAAIAGLLASTLWKTQIKTMNPWAFRTMDFQGVQSDASVDWAHRSLISNLCWGGTGRFVLDYYSGTATNNGSDGYTPTSNPTTSPTTGPAVDGEIIGCFISGANTGYAPTFTPNRSGATAAPLYPPLIGNGPLYCKGITPTGTIPTPPTGHVITFHFSGAGLSGTYSPTYTMLVGDTSLSTLCGNINNQFRSDTTLKAAGIIVPFWGFASSSQIIFQFNRNIGGLGASDLTITASDDVSALTYNIGVGSPGQIKNNQYYHFTYSAIMGGWVGSQSGDHKGPPLEFYAEIANYVGCGVYHNIGHYWSGDRIYQTVLKFGQLGIKRLIVECGNEEWNPFEAQFYSSQILGCCYGFSNVSSTKGSPSAWTAIRTILISKSARQAWKDAGRAATDLFIVMPFQVDAFSATANDSDCNILLNGNDSNNPMNCSGSGSNLNSTLAAYGGYGCTALTTDFTSYPNRPVDYVDAPTHAPYWNGMQMNVQQSNTGLAISGKTATSYSGLLLASYNYANGNSTQQSAALDFLYDGTNGDLYNGTINTGNDNTHRLGSLISSSGVSPANGYFSVGTMNAVYDNALTPRSTLVASGQVAQLLLGYIPYEGGPGIGPITSSDITAVATSLSGLSGYSSGYTSSLSGAASGPSSTAGTDATNIAALWQAFKLDNRFYNLYKRYLTECQAAGTLGGTRACVSIPMQFQIIGPNSVWEIFQTDIGQVTIPYTAVQAFIDFSN